MTKLRMAQPRVGTADTSIAKAPLKQADPFYLTPEWRALRDQLVAQRGRRCEDPGHIGDRDLTDRAIYGDHIHELKDGGAPLVARNVMLMCATCHTQKTNAARAKRMARG